MNEVADGSNDRMIDRMKCNRRNKRNAHPSANTSEEIGIIILPLVPKHRDEMMPSLRERTFVFVTSYGGKPKRLASTVGDRHADSVLVDIERTSLCD